MNESKDAELIFRVEWTVFTETNYKLFEHSFDAEQFHSRLIRATEILGLDALNKTQFYCSITIEGIK